MPTPNGETNVESITLRDNEPHGSLRSLHSSCPPDESRGTSIWRSQTSFGLLSGVLSTGNATNVQSLDQQPTSPPATTDDSCSTPEIETPQAILSVIGGKNDVSSVEMSITTHFPTEAQEENHAILPNTSPSPAVEQRLSALNYEFSNTRLLPSSPSTFLRSGSRFEGSQKSDHQRYEVQVELKYVDIRESFLCGYLRIQGLTDEHASLTTYFEGEIIGNKYSFQTRHQEWGSNERVDMQHWARFPAYRPVAKQAKRADFGYKNFAQRENVFMRWKEYFLVPDHRVRTISGASFEGFYYICFNQVAGTISGIYFHAKSEKYNHLYLSLTIPWLTDK
ncbi:MAG: hypothetical protein M1829_002600 [Trizodia sp. TS-e1964]|nr:MAG: hypothetical protein M1829_002600 [Trizodia sp. TS-e1964]